MLSSPNGVDWFCKGVISKTGMDIRNPSVYVFPNGKILLAAYKYNVYNSKGICAPAENQSPKNFDLLFFVSEDNGTTWLEKEPDLSNVYSKIGKVSPHGRMFIYKNKLLLPVYNRDGSFLLSTQTNGDRWDVFSHIAGGLLEPFVIKTVNDVLIAVMRAGIKSKFGESSLISRYAGDTWTEPVIVTENLQHPACLLLLSNNQLLLTYSDRNFENQRILIKTSKDNGLTWSKAVQVGRSFKNCDFGYPSTLELQDGVLLTVFYAKPSKNPYFYFSNPELYDNMEAKGYYYRYSLESKPK
jgi:hypothetical protein